MASLFRLLRPFRQRLLALNLDALLPSTTRKLARFEVALYWRRSMQQLGIPLVKYYVAIV
jgi:hypothetical protein